MSNASSFSQMKEKRKVSGSKKQKEETGSKRSQELGERKSLVFSPLSFSYRVKSISSLPFCVLPSRVSHTEKQRSFFPGLLGGLISLLYAGLNDALFCKVEKNVNLLVANSC